MEWQYNEALTKRELEILKLRATGLTRAELADKLFIEVKTVDHHITTLLNKMGARHNTPLAIHRAYQIGLIASSSPLPHLADLLERLKGLMDQLSAAMGRLKEQSGE